MDTQKIQELRKITLAGFLDCKKALEESGGDLEKASEHLRKKGIIKAVKKMDRDATEGSIISYIHHNNKIGVLLQLGCETDFVAKNEFFLDLGKNIAMHIAAMSPTYIQLEDVPKEVYESEKLRIQKDLEKENKPKNMIEKISEGKVKKYFSDIVLLEQAYIKEQKSTIQDIIKESIAKLGENISIKKFDRYEIK